jgi:addiction module RelE/StbE family toxin
MRLVWTASALRDRRAIYDFVEQQSAASAAHLDELIAHAANKLLRHPDLGRPGRVQGTRELIIHRHYLVVYDSTGSHVRILRLLHTARRWPPQSR